VADGFNLMPPVLPEMIDVFIAEVVPILQNEACSAPSMRARRCATHLGPARPAVRMDTLN